MLKSSTADVDKAQFCFFYPRRWNERSGVFTQARSAAAVGFTKKNTIPRVDSGGFPRISGGLGIRGIHPGKAPAGTPAAREGALAKNSVSAVSVDFDLRFRRAWGVPWLSAGVFGGLRGPRCWMWFIPVHCEAGLRHKVRCTPCTPTSPEGPNVSLILFPCFQ